MNVEKIRVYKTTYEKMMYIEDYLMKYMGISFELVDNMTTVNITRTDKVCVINISYRDKRKELFDETLKNLIHLKTINRYIKNDRNIS